MRRSDPPIKAQGTLAFDTTADELLKRHDLEYRRRAHLKSTYDRV